MSSPSKARCRRTKPTIEKINTVKKISKNKELREHGYVAYACSRGGQYALHAICQPSPKSFRGVFKTKKAAIEFALKLPRNA